MYLALLVILLHCSSLKAREVFTINKVEIQAAPSLQVHNGDALTILCTADISKSGNFMIEHNFTFFKDGRILSDITSLQNRTEYKIPAARFADTGEYVCMVKAKEKKKKSEVMLVKVTGLPKPKLTALKTEVAEGEELALKCEVPEEAPPLTFTFQKLLTPGGPVTRTKEELEKNFTTVEFLVEPGEKVLRFLCIASVYSAHGMQESAPSNEQLVPVVEHFSTPNLVIEPSLNVTEGDNVKLVCRVVVRNYDIEIIIQKDKVILSSARGQNFLTYFTKVRMEDNGNYTCKVELGSVSKEKTVNMVVTELFSKPELIYPAKIIDEGDWLQLQCNVKGLLPVTKISIKTRYLGKDNLLNDSSSFITRAHVNDTATYICTAEINGIIKESDPVQINVYAPVSIPQLWVAPSVHEVILGGTIHIWCQSLYGTPPITYKFFRGNKTVNSSQIFNKLPAEFKDKPTEVGVEQYSCEASNHHSRIRKRSRELNVTVIASVGKVNLFSVPKMEVEDGKGISFYCYVETGSFPINFKFFKRNNRKPLFEETNMDTRVVSYKKTLSRQDSGEYFCEASNPTNKVQRSDEISINVILASWQKVLIAVFVLVIFVILACGGCWWYLRKKRKAKRPSIEMSGSAGVTNSAGVKLEARQNSDGQYYPGYMDDSENHMKATDENKGPEHEITEVEYTEVEVSTPDPHRAPVQKGTEPVYSEIRKAKNEN
ncbi:PREDICTED: platelet endothelial cell adhesion molecule isoform X4 [Gavialis gangeticus]|uniref:platelet endothelial cell adhesion molecule isoform X4 n=1 Tax=Gavialis gangeticus TaxID=94835 RepID=UPI00092FCBD4|nr:PREDICTED: platelet endothelial cell adhesion molecule isoform X4 [Gavialis gangeticus]